MSAVVIDASVVIRALAEHPEDDLLRQRLSKADGLHAPSHIGVECLNAIRSLVQGGKLTSTRGRQAIEDYTDLPITRHPIEMLAERIWRLRHNCNAYDGAYVALAQEFGLTLLTRDRKLAATAPGDVDVHVHPSGPSA